MIDIGNDDQRRKSRKRRTRRTTKDTKTTKKEKRTCDCLAGFVVIEGVDVV